MSRRAILSLTRRYALGVLFYPRDGKGRPEFPEEEGPAGGFLYGLALGRGLPHPEALAWAKRRADAGRRKGD